MSFPLNRVFATTVCARNVSKSFWETTFSESFLCIGTDAVKTYSLDDLSDICLAIDFE